MSNCNCENCESRLATKLGEAEKETLDAAREIAALAGAAYHSGDPEDAIARDMLSEIESIAIALKRRVLTGEVPSWLRANDNEVAQ